ncbi:MAG TPA: hypothetical protein VFA84_10305 [Acidimicrobiales bacterium]|nr:hypothetical protein [Acidimicrobiales bacterium]
MWDARDDVILTEAERKVLAELEAVATRRGRVRDVWGRLRARPIAFVIGSVVMLSLALCVTTLTFASSLAVGIVGSLLVLASLAALFDSAMAFAEGRERRRGSRRHPSGGGRRADGPA